jgi:alpha-mannosidase
MADLSWVKSLLRQCNQRSLQSQWFAYGSERAVEPLGAAPLPLNDRGHIAWEKGRSVLWLGQDVQIPETWNGYPLRGLTAKLALTWWAEEAIVFVDGQAVQAGDLFDCSARIILTDRVRGGECFRVRVRLVSPGHDPGALVKSQLELEDLRESSGGNSLPEPSWLAEELAIVEAYLQAHCPQEIPKLKHYCQEYGQPLFDSLHQSWDILHHRLATLRDTWIQHWGDQIRQRRIHLLGHAHLDLAWLWPVAETWAAAERTFRSVLALQRDFPELIFAHSSPVVYHWLEQHRPDLFQEIYAAIQRGQWETIAGMWVEPDTILPNGESLVRQVLYGQQYVQERLGQRNRVVWLPDSFGFSHQLPQILKQGGIDWFITQKLTWNDTTTFPHALFQWQSPDSTIALALMSAPIGKGIEPLGMMEGALAWEQTTGLKDYLWLPGVGDHGGGPSRDMLETARRWQTSPCFPQLGFSRLHDYLGHIEPHLDRSALPVWTEDLYLELHRGCYTSHGDQKQWNRHLEDLLYRAELWATWAECLVDQPFPHRELEQAWKLVLFNQFHDILPGSSIPEVFEQANQEWQQAQDLAETILSRSLQTLSDRITPNSPPNLSSQAGEYWTIAVFNSIPQGVMVSDQGVVSDEVVSEQHPNQWIDSKTQHSKLKTQHSKLKTQNSKLKTQHSPPKPLSSILHLTPKTQPSTLNTQHSTLKTPSCPLSPVPSQAWDIHGQPLPTQRLANQDLLVLLPERSGVGYTQIHLKSTPDELIPDQASSDQNSQGHSESSAIEALLASPVELHSTTHHYSLENRYLRVTIDRTTGHIAELYSHLLQRNLLQAPGNQLQCFRDRGQYWDAWNIDPNYEQQPLTPPQLVTCEIQDQGVLRCSVRVCYQFVQGTDESTQKSKTESTIEQIYYLDYESPWIGIDTTVNWQADQVLLKVAFPWDFESDLGTENLGENRSNNLDNPLAPLKCVTESACGVVERSTHPRNDREAAQWEVPIHRWIDLSTPTPTDPWGVSILNTGKYGADVKGSCLRLSLLRSPLWPDPYSDRGMHQFTYALYPHAGGWESAQTVTFAHQLNCPLNVVPLPREPKPERIAELVAECVQNPSLPSSATLLRFGAPNLHLMSFHPHPQQSGYVLRCYESAGQTTALEFQISDRVEWDKTIVPLTGLEEIGVEEITEERDDRFSGTDHRTVHPWQIRSWLLRQVD